jgi:hypothetical protein
MLLGKACREFLIAFSLIRVPQIPRGISVAQTTLEADHQKMRRLKGFRWATSDTRIAYEVASNHGASSCEIFLTFNAEIPQRNFC